MSLQSFDLNKTVTAWSALQGTIYLAHNEEEYNRLVTLLDNLIDEVGEDETHPLASLMEVVGLLVENYEAEYVPELTN